MRALLSKSRVGGAPAKSALRMVHRTGIFEKEGLRQGLQRGVANAQVRFRGGALDQRCNQAPMLAPGALQDVADGCALGIRNRRFDLEFDRLRDFVQR
jgi:hypothetical protein